VFSEDCVNRSERDNENGAEMVPNEMTNEERKPESGQVEMSGWEKIQAELNTAKSIDEFFGREGIFARLFSKTLEQMLDAELTTHLRYEKYEAKGRNSGNSRNGKYTRSVRSSGGGHSEIAVPRDRNGEFEPKILHKYETSSNELEDKIVTLSGSAKLDRISTSPEELSQSKQR
jgi:transposase-like protein